MHRGELGTLALNAALQAKVNPGDGGAELKRSERVYRRGDKVMQLRNDYDRGVWNGDLGRIAMVDAEAGAVSVQFPDGRLVVYDRTELDQLTHGYAASVHKSQGSEYPAVVISLATQHFMMLERSLIYTAVTRGKRLVVVVGSRRALGMAIRNMRSQHRLTWLAERLRVAAEIGSEPGGDADGDSDT